MKVAYPMPILPHDARYFPRVAGLEKPVPEVPIGLEPSARDDLERPHAQQVVPSPLHGVTRLSLVVDEHVSQSFNNGLGLDNNGRYHDAHAGYFCFAPGVDVPRIAWKVRHHQRFQHVRLELFRRGDPTPIWTREWRDDKITGFITADPVALGDKTATGSLDWSEVQLDHPDFPDGIVTVEYSPYQLRMTIDGNHQGTDGQGYPLVAWTHFHVLIHDIELDWGDPEWISGDQTDVTGDQDEALARRRALFEAVAGSGLSLCPDGNEPGRHHDVLVNISAFKSATTVEPHARERWGNGPLIPLRARLSVRRADKTGTDAPLALGRAKVLWEWQDSEGETIPELLAARLGQPDEGPETVTPITRDYLEGLLQGLASAAYPRHIFNAPADAGGKRGVPGPGDGPSPVFLPRFGLDEFPFVVAQECSERRWTAISYPDRDGTTGVLFQPTFISGDRYKLSVYPGGERDEDGNLALDRVEQDGAYFDLLAAAADIDLPCAHTRVFEVWREVHATYYYGPAFQGTHARTIAALRRRFKRELGLVAHVEAAPFPDLEPQRDRHLLAQVAAEAELQTYGKALALHLLFHGNPQVDGNYAFTSATRDQTMSNLVAMFAGSPLHVMRFSSAVPATQLQGQTSGARGIVVPTPGGYGRVDGVIVLGLGGPPFQVGEQVDVLTTPPTQVTLVAIDDGYFFPCWELDVQVLRRPTLEERDIRVESLGSVEPLRYDEGLVWATRSLVTDGNTARRDRLRVFLGLLPQALAFDPTGILNIEIFGRGADDRDHERAENVRRFIADSCVPRKALYDCWRAQNLTYAHGGYMSDEQDLHEQLLPPYITRLFDRAFREVVAQHDDYARFEQDGRIFFYQLYGFTRLDVLRAGAFEAGSSTNKIAWAYVMDPPPGASLKWLKPATDVVVHEFGHALCLAHSPCRLFDTQAAGGAYQEHLAHDHCVMNYDPDTQSFCAGCILSTWGWTKWLRLVPALGEVSSALWQGQCHLRLQQLCAADEHPASALRLAMFEMDMLRDRDAATAAIQLAIERTPAIGDARHVWLLRNLIVYYNKLGDEDTALEKAHALLGITQSAPDIDDLIDPERNVRVHSMVGQFWEGMEM